MSYLGILRNARAKCEGMGSEGVSCEVIGGEVMRSNGKFKLKVVKFEVNFYES
ncbi:MAG: hypothetical protein GY908_05660 [Flavobacteriales bacterium]|nr:hypothetical protein [Flavobacteriales bacterium]